MMWNPFRFKKNADIEKIKDSALHQGDKNTYDCARKELKRRNNKFKK